MPVRAHDLLRVRDPRVLAAAGPIPTWAARALAAAPWVVARRALAASNAIPVGVRGPTRAERFASFVPIDAIEERLSPEGLARRRASPERAREVPALAALPMVAEILAALPWGPTGAVGFELAAGVPAATASSDLDLIIRSPHPLSRASARALLRDLAAATAVRLDVQLETPHGAVSLAELATAESVLLRAHHGPRLVRDPWCAPP